MRRCIVLWAIVLIGVAHAAPLEAQPVVSDEQAARIAFQRGRAAYDDGRFAEAATAFEEAYRLSGRDALLYNLYLAHRDANQQEKAAEALRAFLAKVRNVENRGQLEARLKALDEGIAWEKAQREQARREAEAARLTAPSGPSAAERARTRRLRLASYALGGAGGAMLIGALATGVSAHKREGELEDACDVNKRCPADLEDTADRGERLAHTSDGLLVVGLAAAGVGVTLFVLSLRGREPSEQTPKLGAACARAGCAAQLSVGF